MPVNGWAALALAVALAIRRILDWFSQRERTFKQGRNQRERDSLAKNPSGWFSDHFGGMRSSARTDTPTKPNKADTEHHPDA